VWSTCTQLSVQRCCLQNARNAHDGILQPLKYLPKVEDTCETNPKRNKNTVKVYCTLKKFDFHCAVCACLVVLFLGKGPRTSHPWIICIHSLHADKGRKGKDDGPRLPHRVHDRQPKKKCFLFMPNFQQSILLIISDYCFFFS
jgi:hypothetical protein